MMKNGNQKVGTEQLRTWMARSDVQIVDVRPIEAYNGWCLRSEPRGGHIPGARALPFHWSEYVEWVEIVRGKELDPQRPLVVYGYDHERIRRVSELFRRLGFTDVWVYEDFLSEWAPNEDLPLDRLARYSSLVSPQWVWELVSGVKASEFNGGRYVVCHAHYRNRADYEEGHIPGALPLDTLALESPETWNRRSPDEVERALLELGITADTTVVLYGRFGFPRNEDPFPGSSAGQLAAFRCAFIMLWAGVKDVRVLNGGIQAWEDAGLPVSTDEVVADPAVDFGADVPAAPAYAVDLPEARDILASSDANLVSVRSWPEYIGEVSGYNYIEKRGRIPGSVWGDCGSDAYHMENYRNLDHTVREYAEVAAIWEKAGITPDKQNAFYCGTGWRGSEAFFNAWLMGWPKVAVFDGGWFEWSNDPTLPTATGVPEGSLVG